MIEPARTYSQTSHFYHLADLAEAIDAFTNLPSIPLIQAYRKLTFHVCLPLEQP